MKKCLVLDLDNTLWGGVIGEDGMENIALSLDPPGNGFMAFQQAILNHYHRGVILAINSRNNPDDAWEVIRTHPNMILKENHFAAARINWNDKAENLRELAEELNIGLDAIVFLDDDPTNRALVRALVPEVETPDLPPDPSQYAAFLNSLNCFTSHAVTDEDTMRGNFYVTERLRKEEEKKYERAEDFLHNLSLNLSVFEDNDSSISRLSQLTDKTNQFNIAKQLLTEDEIDSYIKSPDHRVFHSRLQDKFGDHGIIAFALVDVKRDEWHIRCFLMSCRVFGRGVEDTLLSVIFQRAWEAGVMRVTILFKETPKNQPAREFIEAHFDHGEVCVPTVPFFPTWMKVHYGSI